MLFSKGKYNFAKNQYLFPSAFGLCFIVMTFTYPCTHNQNGHEAKYNVQPIEQIYNHGFKRHDILMIEAVIEENKDIIINRWNEYFKEDK